MDRPPWPADQPDDRNRAEREHYGPRGFARIYHGRPDSHQRSQP